MPSDDVVERIRKLLRLADDAGATEAEAAAALERASALLLRHNLSMDQVAVASGEAPSITEQPIRTGWAGSWRAPCSASWPATTCARRWSAARARSIPVIVVGRPANVQATHALYDWIAAQLKRFDLKEWNTFNQELRPGPARSQRAGPPWHGLVSDSGKVFATVSDAAT